MANEIDDIEINRTNKNNFTLIHFKTNFKPKSFRR